MSLEWEKWWHPELEEPEIVLVVFLFQFFFCKHKKFYESEVVVSSLDITTTSDTSSASDPSAISDDGHSILMSDLVSVILEDRDPYITGKSARKGVDIVLGILKVTENFFTLACSDIKMNV